VKEAGTAVNDVDGILSNVGNVDWFSATDDVCRTWVVETTGVTGSGHKSAKVHAALKVQALRWVHADKDMARAGQGDKQVAWKTLDGPHPSRGAQARERRESQEIRAKLRQEGGRLDPQYDGWQCGALHVHGRVVRNPRRRLRCAVGEVDDVRVANGTEHQTPLSEALRKLVGALVAHDDREITLWAHTCGRAQRRDESTHLGWQAVVVAQDTVVATAHHLLKLCAIARLSAPNLLKPHGGHNVCPPSQVLLEDGRPVSSEFVDQDVRVWHKKRVVHGVDAAVGGQCTHSELSSGHADVIVVGGLPEKRLGGIRLTTPRGPQQEDDVGPVRWVAGRWQFPVE
jgi:hypothetical protein